ncbi:hypothetical protein [Rugamonas rivuli]|uniref:CHAP domain-containing protein n=1 Tax=Rugamonas rivuli TaxID=2743358 RepID=A0A843S7P7_9BURK|nr:hypothetical protein [Rugamonas rivuli]MQA20445.1 hypothetical protein [Rugamonas rivuli]
MTINIEKFVEQLKKNAGKISQRRCAKYVRLALEAGGARTTGHPHDAKAWGPTLLRNGFHVVASDDPAQFSAEKGDVVVMQPPAASGAGHIQAYDGKNWVSDFVQTGFWPGPAYRKERPGYVVYRP